MLARRSLPRASFLAARALAALLVAIAVAGCASMRTAAGIQPRATIAFENMSREPVRVYLVEEDGGHYLLGNVHAMEEASLRVPRHMGLTDARRVSLAVVPMSRGVIGPLQPQYAMTSPTADSVLGLATLRWTVTSSALFSQGGGGISIGR